uniref:EF-hand domain-containing protein n=1 Tax=Dendroctonus ponderosae TaxID=77166 RepID=A0AAR5QDU1_DENPD
MRPYKKRSFFNQHNHDNAVEMDNSDDTEVQANCPANDDSAEKARDKEDEPKGRKKWKRKISRKQFRHHNIKLFTPGEYRSSTLLKQTDSAPSVSKDLTEVTKDSILESIVSSLGGNKQLLPRGEEALNSKEAVEENNNMNCFRNHNNVGKHQLPAIVPETPTVRRRSAENIQIAKPVAGKPPEQPSSAQTTAQDETVGAKFAHSEASLKPFELPANNVRFTLKPSVRLSMESSKSSNKLRENHLESTQNVDGRIVIDKPMQSSSALFEKNFQLQQRQTKFFENQPERLFAQTNSAEIPVDLSRKTTIYNQRDFELMQHAELMRQIDKLKNAAAQSQLKVQKPAINLSNSENKHIGHSHYYKSRSQQEIISKLIEAKQREKYSRPTAESIQEFLRNNPIPPHSDAEIFKNTILKISNMCQLENMLRALFRQPLTLEVLRSMCQAFLQLDAAREDPGIPSEFRSEAQAILHETYNFISNVLKSECPLNLDIMKAIKSFGQSDGTSGEIPIDVIRNLSINDAPKLPRFVPQSAQPKGYSELNKLPPHYNGRKVANAHTKALSSLHLYSGASSPQAGDLPGPLEHSPPIARNEMIPKRNEPNWIFPIVPNSVERPVAPNIPYYTNPAGIQVRFALPNMYNAPKDPRSEPTPQNTLLGKPRSKLYKHLDTVNAAAQKSSFSHPHADPNQEYIYMKAPSAYREASKPSQGNVFLRPSALSASYQQNNMETQKIGAPPAFATSYFQSTKEPPVNRNMPGHSSPDYVKQFSSAFSISQHPNLEIQHSIVRPSLEQQMPKAFNANHNRDATPPTKHLEVAKFISNASQVRDRAEMMELQSPVVKEKPKTLPAVIVADNSMQITKEPTKPQKELTVNQDRRESPKCDHHLAEPTKEKLEKDHEENNSEFFVWLEKLKKNKKLKSKFLSQMGIIKKEEPVADSDCIEIVDSDEDMPEIVDDNQATRAATVIITVPSSVEPTKTPTIAKAPSKSCQKSAQQDSVAKISVPQNLEITPVPPTTATPTNISNPQLRRTPKHSLSKRVYMPPIPLPYQQSASTLETASKVEAKKTIYSPEIEPISPPNHQSTAFTFPEAQPSATKALSPSANSTERGIILNESVASPSYVQKRKSSDFPEYPKDSPTKPEFSLDNGSKRRKSLDRPQTSISPRVAPSGKLHYRRDKHMFLRYFDDTQVALYIKSLSSQDDEMPTTTAINPDNMKNAFKPFNFYVEQPGKTEIVNLPKDVEFSTKEDLPDVEEFVKESSLVEKYVPKDFADFYRYVTGFQIIKNKHPVSLETFLTMYNTNRTSELLRKYLQRLDEDSSGAVSR